MVHLRWTGWVLGLLVASGASASAQSAPVQTVSGPPIELRENSPNPFFPSTTITFALAPEVCSRNHQPTVSLKIYNVLVQVVAVPTLPGEPPLALDGVKLRCGEYRVPWDGRFLDGQREITPGVYYYQLTVDGQRFTRKMIAQRNVTSER
jgi:hypothetical protein